MRQKLRSERKFDAALSNLDAHGACHLDMGDDSASAAPDYTPVAQASKESAQIMADLGRAQLDESKRQYEQNMAVVKPVVEVQ